MSDAHLHPLDADFQTWIRTSPEHQRQSIQLQYLEHMIPVLWVHIGRACLVLSNFTIDRRPEGLSLEDRAEEAFQRQNIRGLGITVIRVQREITALRESLHTGFCMERGIDMSVLLASFAASAANLDTATFIACNIAGDQEIAQYADGFEDGPPVPLGAKIAFQAEITREAERIRARGLYLPMPVDREVLLQETIHALAVFQPEVVDDALAQPALFDHSSGHAVSFRDYAEISEYFAALSLYANELDVDMAGG